jgi:hypothetical protein
VSSQLSLLIPRTTEPAPLDPGGLRPGGPYTLAGRTFKGREALRGHLRRAVAYGRPVNEEFWDDVLSAVIQQHPRYRGFGVPTSFAFRDNGSDPIRKWKTSLSALYAKSGWRRVSYNRAIEAYHGQLTFDRVFEQMCRERWQRLWRDRLFLRTRCQGDGCRRWATDVDHCTRKHKDIVLESIALITEEERTRFMEWYFSPERRSHARISDGHASMVRYDALTEDTGYQMLCKRCHYRRR